MEKRDSNHSNSQNNTHNFPSHGQNYPFKTDDLDRRDFDVTQSRDKDENHFMDHSHLSHNLNNTGQQATMPNQNFANPHSRGPHGNNHNHRNTNMEHRSAHNDRNNQSTQDQFKNPNSTFDNNLRHRENQNFNRRVSSSDENPDEIAKIYNKYQFKNKTKKNVKFDSKITLNWYVPKHYENEIIENYKVDDLDEKRSSNAEDSDRKNKSKIEIYECKSREDIEKIKKALIFKIDALCKKIEKNIDVNEELKELKDMIQLLDKVSKNFEKYQKMFKNEELQKKKMKEKQMKKAQKQNEENIDSTSTPEQSNTLAVSNLTSNWTDWLFEHIYGEKQIHLIIYFDLPYLIWTKANFQNEMFSFFRQIFFKKFKVSLICQNENVKFLHHELNVENSQPTLLNGCNIYECLATLNWPQNFLNAFVHVKDCFHNQIIFQSNISEQYYDFYKRQNMTIFELKYNYLLNNFNDSKNLQNFNFSEFSEILNLHLFKQMLKLTEKKFSLNELFILRRLTFKENELDAYKRKNLPFLKLEKEFSTINGEILANEGENHNRISLYYNNNVKILNDKPIYEFRDYIYNIFWVELVNGLDELFALMAQYYKAKEYVDMFNSTSNTYKLKMSKMFGIVDNDKKIYFVNQTNKNIDKSNLETEDAIDIDLESLMNAFTHFTYEKSNRELIIIDLRPIKCATFISMIYPIEHILITEPIVFSRKNVENLSAANLSSRGIDFFINQEHTCNKYCQELKLIPNTKL